MGDVGDTAMDRSMASSSFAGVAPPQPWVRMDRNVAQRRKTTHRMAQYMYAASQMPAAIRDSW